MDQINLFKEYKDVFKEAEEIAPKEKKERVFGYSPFALQDAIGERSAKKTWIEYEKLRFDGIEAEELIHKIISKVRDMLAISLGASKEDLGIKSDYPYNKSKRGLKNWKKEELKNLFTKLIEIYHRSRMGARPNDYSVGRGDDLDTAIEKAVLDI